MIGVSLEVDQLIFTDLSFAGDSVALPHQAAQQSATNPATKMRPFAVIADSRFDPQGIPV